MLRCCLCQALGASLFDHDEGRLEHLLDHAVIHQSQINRFAKTNMFKLFADCFPKIAVTYTVREIVDSLDASRDGGSKDDTEGKITSVSAKNIRNVQQRQETVSVKNTEKWSRIHKKRKRSHVRPSTNSINVQCRRILDASCDKRQRRFHCAVCDDLVVLRTAGQSGVKTWFAIDHVLSNHLDIKPFRCLYCDHTTKVRPAMSSHVKHVHRTDHRSVHFTNEINTYKKNICEMVETCFGKKQWKATNNDPTSKTESTKQCKGTTLVAENGNRSVTYDRKRKLSHGPSMIHPHCRRTIASYSAEEHRIECGVCNQFIAVRYGPKALVNTTPVIQHALTHMGIKPFRCRYCTSATKTQTAMCSHLRNAHRLAASSSIHYINEISIHEKEICGMITTCFGKKDQRTPGVKKLPPAPIRNPIHEFCQKTIPASYRREQRGFECGVCHKLITLRTGPKPLLRMPCVMSHVLSCHLDIQPYRCRYCDYTAPTASAVGKHVTRIHKTDTAGNVHYVDSTQDYQKEICEMVMKCFGAKSPASNCKANDSDDATEGTKQSDTSERANSEMAQSPSLTSPPSS